MRDFVFGTGVGFEGNSGGNEYFIDSKAMRKVNDSEDLIIVFEGSASGDGVTIVSAGRILIRES
jgi:hypothetical protein